MVDAGREKNNSDDKIAPTNLPTLDLLPGALGEQYIPPCNAWVRCDGCHKWRRIPTELADVIEETKCTWYIVIHCSTIWKIPVMWKL